jgi:hypothetical protein
MPPEGSNSLDAYVAEFRVPLKGVCHAQSHRRTPFRGTLNSNKRLQRNKPSFDYLENFLPLFSSPLDILENFLPFFFTPLLFLRKYLLLN